MGQLSNTETPYYYGLFRDAVLRGEIPVCETISMEMNRIDALIADPGVYYDRDAINGYKAYCEQELTLMDGEDLHLMDTFLLWAEQVFGWYYFVDRSVYEPVMKFSIPFLVEANLTRFALLPAVDWMEPSVRN